MNELTKKWRQSSPVVRHVAVAIAAVVAVVLALAVLVVVDRPMLLIVAAIVVCGGLAMLRWPDLTTLCVIGLIYSNLPVVLVEYHGAPSQLPAAVLAMLGWPLLFHIVIRKEKLLIGSAAPFLLVYLLVQLIGALLARDTRMAFDHVVSFVLEGVLLYFLISNLIRTKRMALATFWVLAGCALLMGGVPLAQQLTRSSSDFGGLAQVDSQFRTAEDAIAGVIRQTRAAGTIGEQNRYAQFMVLLVPFCLALIAINRSGKQWWFAVAATISALLGFALAFSRGAAVGFLLAFLVGVWMKLISRLQVKLALIGIALVLLLMPQYLTRLASLGGLASIGNNRQIGLVQSDGAVRGRLTEMGAAVLAFRDHPLFGVGPGMFGAYSKEYGQIIGLRPLGRGRQAHSMPLEIAAESGLLGLFAMIGVFYAIYRTLLIGRKKASERNDHVGNQLVNAVLLAVTLYLTTGLFLHISYLRYLWLLIGMAEAIGFVVANRDNGDDYLPFSPGTNS